MLRLGGVVIHMDNRITLLAGCEELTTYPEKPFSKEVLCFFEQIASEIRTGEAYKSDQEIKAFGFWCRRSNLEKMTNQFKKGDVGIGKVFHIVASNVPCLFAYSLAMSMLCGNANQVRISTRVFEQDKRLISLFNKLLMQDENASIRNRISIITYERSNEITEKLLNDSDGYIVWGGDETVKSIRSLVSNPDLIELVFPDRYSIAMFEIKDLLNKSEEELRYLVHRFYNDTYQVHQNACSSPRFVFWKMGEESKEEREILKNRFWQMLLDELDNYNLEDDAAYRKYEALVLSCMKNGNVEHVEKKNMKLLVATVSKLNQSMKNYTGNNGVFYQMDIESVREIALFCDKKLQTIVYAGIDPEEILEGLLKGHAKGARRIVPVGEALTMLEVWDGKRVYSLLTKSMF